MEKERRSLSSQIPSVIRNLERKLDRGEVLGKRDLRRVRFLTSIIDRKELQAFYDDCVQVLYRVYFFLRSLAWRARNWAERQIFDVIYPFREQLGIAHHERVARSHHLGLPLAVIA